MSPDPQIDSQLHALRASIEEVDAELVRLIAKRTRLAVEAGLLKHRGGQPLRDEAQEEVVQRRAAAFAADEGLDVDCMVDVFEDLLRIARAAQFAALSGRR